MLTKQGVDAVNAFVDALSSVLEERVKRADAAVEQAKQTNLAIAPTTLLMARATSLQEMQVAILQASNQMLTAYREQLEKKSNADG